MDRRAVLSVFVRESIVEVGEIYGSMVESQGCLTGIVM